METLPRLFSARSIDESTQRSVYFTPNEGHLSPQPLQTSPIHINYMNDISDCDGILGEPSKSWKSVTRAPKNFVHHHHHHPPPSNPLNPHHRYSYTPKLNPGFLDEEDEEHFIIPDQVYRSDTFDLSCDCFNKIIPELETVEQGQVARTSRGQPQRDSLKSLPSSSGYSSRLKNRQKESQTPCEKENLLTTALDSNWAPQVYEFSHHDPTEAEGHGVFRRKKKTKLSDAFYSLEEIPGNFGHDRTEKIVGSASSNHIESPLPAIEEKKSSDGLESKDSALAPNINELLQDEKCEMDNKLIVLQPSNSLPEILAAGAMHKSTEPSSVSSSSNNNSLISSININHNVSGKNVILALDEKPGSGSKLNQIDREWGEGKATQNGTEAGKIVNKGKHIVLNIDPKQSMSNSTLMDGDELELNDVSTSSV